MTSFLAEEAVGVSVAEVRGENQSGLFIITTALSPRKCFAFSPELPRGGRPNNEDFAKQNQPGVFINRSRGSP